MLVNFGPLINLPKVKPPMSDAIQPNNNINNINFNSRLYENKVKIEQKIEWGREVYSSKHGVIKFRKIIMPYSVVGVALIYPWCFQILQMKNANTKSFYGKAK